MILYQHTLILLFKSLEYVDPLLVNIINIIDLTIYYRCNYTLLTYIVGVFHKIDNKCVKRYVDIQLCKQNYIFCIVFCFFTLLL